MVSIKEKVDAELENISKILIELEKVKDIHPKELVVIVGIGAYLQNIYMGMENILKQLLFASYFIWSKNNKKWIKKLCIKLNLK